jgi:hypothetical protein
MYLSKLGFFKEKSAIKRQNLVEQLNLLTANLNNNLLRKMLCAYLQKKLYSLIIHKDLSQNQSKKRRRLIPRLKFTVSKGQGKKRLRSYKMRAKGLNLTSENSDQKRLGL